MKNTCTIIFLTIFLVGCDEVISKNTPKEKNLLVLKCSSQYPGDVIYIWDQTSNSLKISEKNGIPHKSSDQFETIFEKVPLEISGGNPKITYEFREYANTLRYIRDWTEVKLDDPDCCDQYHVIDYDCKVIEDNR